MVDAFGNDEEITSTSKKGSRNQKKGSNQNKNAGKGNNNGKKTIKQKSEVTKTQLSSEQGGQESDKNDEGIENNSEENDHDTDDDEPLVGKSAQQESEESGDDAEDIQQTNDSKNRMRIMKTANHVVDFSRVIKEINKMDFGIIDINSKALAASLSKFVAVGSLLHKLTPEDISVIANLNGNYPHKETKDVTDVDGREVPNTIRGLLANGTKFFDALVYLSMDEEIRPKPIFLEFEKAADGTIEIPTYDDMSKLTTFIFVAYFFVVIRAHAPSDNGIYANQPIPNFIANIMNCKSTVTEVSDYISSFDLIKLSPEWVKFIPTTSISQESVNRLGLGVAGYRLVSVFNVISPDMYTEKNIKDEEYKYATKPAYLDVAVDVMRSFRQAGYCWNFHPATRSPEIMSTYGNINKNAGNLILECYTKKTLEKLKNIKKLSVIPQFDPAHTEYRTWTLDMRYKASHRIFQKIEKK